MTNQEKKTYILRNWTTSDGKRITEMLKRYWKPIDAYEQAKEIFTS